MRETIKNNDDPARQLVRQLIADRGLTMKELSIKCKLNHAYFQQYLNKGKPVELHEVVREKLSEIFSIHADRFRAVNASLNIDPQAEIPADVAEKGETWDMERRFESLKEQMSEMRGEFNFRISTLERQVAELTAERSPSPKRGTSKEQ